MSSERTVEQESIEEKLQRTKELAEHCLGEDPSYVVTIQTDEEKKVHRLDTVAGTSRNNGEFPQGFIFDAEGEAHSLLAYNQHIYNHPNLFRGVREKDQIVAIGNDIWNISWTMPMSAILLYSMNHDVEFKFKGREESWLADLDRHAPEKLQFRQGTLISAHRISRPKDENGRHRIIDFYQTSHTLETKYPYLEANVLWPSRTRKLTKIWAFVTQNPEEMIGYLKEKCGDSHELRPLPGFCDADVAIEIHDEANENEAFAILAYSPSQWQSLIKED
jgi:hypothetical protein